MWRDRWYFTQPFEPPEWRARWVEHLEAMSFSGLRLQACEVLRGTENGRFLSWAAPTPPNIVRPVDHKQ